jgi:hypothetical protein
MPAICAASAGLARGAAMPAGLRGFFAGARWSLLGLLAMAATTAYYIPNAAQFPLWFCLGLAFAWDEPAAATRCADAARRAAEFVNTPACRRTPGRRWQSIRPRARIIRTPVANAQREREVAARR